MKRFGKILKDIFTKNLPYKILAVALAALAVVLINL